MTTVVAYVPDLMDRSKVASALPEARFVREPAGLLDTDANVIVVDLSRPGVLGVLPDLAGRRVLGFASHVDTATMEAARAAGCEVFRRSAFFGNLATLV
jgi:hypothetical protein